MMPLCPPPARKHTAFGPSNLARGLQTKQGMRVGSLSLAVFAMSICATAQAQQSDRVNRIDGFVLDATEDAWFNEDQCADPSNTTYQLRISTQTGASVTNVYLWAGRENGECNLNDNRTDIQENCREIAGNPRTVEPDNLISNLTLQELVDTGVVACDTSGLEGTPYEIFAFRNSDPGSTDVPEGDFGISPIIVDVTPPAALNINSDVTQVGSNFSIQWTRPTDNIWIYRFYENDVDDAETATLLENVTAGQNETSKTISAANLGMGVGDTRYLYVAAQDRAFIESSGANGGNLGPLSVGTQVNFVETAGVCSATGDCGGCAVATIDRAARDVGSAILVISLAAIALAGWRRRP